MVSFKDGELQVKSARYPFCATGDVKNDNSIRSAMALVPFNSELNRLLLVVKNGAAASYKVTWGEKTKSFSSVQLAKGVNLAEEFEVNPFSRAFERVDGAVAAKQEYETRQIKTMFHGPEMKQEPDTMVRLTEKVRAPLAAAMREAVAPVTHSIRIVAE